MADNNKLVQVQKQVIREQLMRVWDIKIPASRANRLTLAQLTGIKSILEGK